MQLFPENVRRFWNGWEIRILVLLSLSLQTILTLFGSRRKYTAGIWLRILVWSAYLAADWVATVVLGNLATSDGDCEENSPKSNSEIHGFWAPFLLLHLGGPDSITAYSLEDNELWLRHFLALVVQVGVAFCVFLRFWSNTSLTFMTIPIFIVACVKYGERTLVLRSSSKENFKDSVLPTDPKPGGEFCANPSDPESQQKGSHMIRAYVLFKTLAHLFSGQILRFGEAVESYKYFIGLSAEDAFNLVAVELGFMYDLLYTKAKIVCSRLGIFARCFSLCFLVFTFVMFSRTIAVHPYPQVDIFITYLLLAGAIVLELYTLILHFFSDWTKLCLSKYKKEDHPYILYATSLSHPCLSNHKRWSESMGQFNLISFCVKDKWLAPAAWMSKLLEHHKHLSWEDASVDLQKLIFEELIEKIGKVLDQETDLPLWENLLAHRGDHVLKKYNIQDPGMLWLTASAPYDCSLIAWHIATDLCYRHDVHQHFNGNPESHHPRCKISKCLSEYMLYLMVLCPMMMPEGFSDARYLKTFEEMNSVFAKGPLGLREILVLDIFRQIPDDGSTVQDRVKNDLSVFKPGYWLGQQLQLLESKEDWRIQKKWNLISEVWVEILAYTASHCAWNVHGQYLRKGGELLTHVCLLMAHLGLSSQYGLFGSEAQSTTDAFIRQAEIISYLSNFSQIQ